MNPDQCLQKQSRNEVKRSLWGVIIFILKFGGTNSAIDLYFICLSSEKLMSHPIPPHFLFPPVLQDRLEKGGLQREEPIFPFLFNYFVTPLLLGETSLHSLLTPIGKV